MIDKVIGLIDKTGIPHRYRVILVPRLQQIEDTRKDISGQNHVLYIACGIVLDVLPSPYAEGLKAYLCKVLTMPVSYETVKRSIRPNRNQPITLATGELDPVEIE